MPVKSNIYVQGTPVRLQVRQNPLIGTDPRRRRVLPDPEHPIDGLDPPPAHQRATKALAIVASRK